MLKSGMGRFYLSVPLRRSLPVKRWGGAALVCLVHLLAGPGVHAAGPPVGLLVQLKPGVVPTEADVPPLALRDTPQAVQERAHARWQRQHAATVRHFDQVARQAGVAYVAAGSAGEALRVDVTPGTDSAALDNLARRLRLHPDVAEVLPNERLRRRAVVPTDPQFARQWHLLAPSAYAGAVNATTGWMRTTGANAPATVAVVDTGVRFDHPDLSGKLLAGYDFVSEVEYANDGDGRDADASDPGDWLTASEAGTTTFRGCDPEDSSWHGTAIAGVIAAGANNGVGVTGLHWGARVLPVRVAAKCGAVLSDLLDGVRWAAGLPVDGVPANPHPAKVINLSYGGDGACNTAYQSTIDAVSAAGALVVVAAGNAGAPVTRPADCRGVLAVTAVRGDGAKASYGSYGPTVGLAAPGGSGFASSDEGIYTTLNAGRRGPTTASYGYMVGTSFSAPLAAGAAALALSVQPGLSGAALSQLLTTHARPHTQQPQLAACSPTAWSQGSCNCTSQTCGSGLLDVDLVLAAAQGVQPGTSPGTPVTPPVVTPSDGGGGSTGWAWGLGLWLWLWAVRRHAINCRVEAPCS